MAEFKNHPFADLFPMLPPKQLASLAADIKAHGLQHAIIVDQHDRVVDGRNRLAACERAGVKPLVQERHFATDLEVLDFIVSANLERRHLDETERAMIAARIATMKSGDYRGKMSASPIGEADNGGPLFEVSRDEAADRLNVTTRTLDRARRVQRDAIPEIQHMVERGELKVSPAAEVAALPAEEQQQMATLGAEEIVRTMRARRKQGEKAQREEEESQQREEEEPKQEEQSNGKPKRRPVGLRQAAEAINCLKRIPKNDAHRKNGLKRVRDWIRRNP